MTSTFFGEETEERGADPDILHLSEPSNAPPPKSRVPIFMEFGTESACLCLFGLYVPPPPDYKINTYSWLKYIYTRIKQFRSV